MRCTSPGMTSMRCECGRVHTSERPQRAGAVLGRPRRVRSVMPNGHNGPSCDQPPTWSPARAAIGPCTSEPRSPQGQSRRRSSSPTLAPTPRSRATRCSLRSAEDQIRNRHARPHVLPQGNSVTAGWGNYAIVVEPIKVVGWRGIFPLSYRQVSQSSQRFDSPNSPLRVRGDHRPRPATPRSVAGSAVCGARSG